MIILKERADTIYVWRHIHLNRSRALIFFTLLSLSFMLFMINKHPFAQVGLLFIPLSYGLGVYTYRKVVTWSMGSRGEDRVVDALKGLGDEYLILNSVIIPPNRGDADHILLGPNGIFVIETKNITGTVKCDGDDWTRFKKGKKGFSYPIDIGNPSKQVKRNAKSLKDLILKHEFEVFASGAPHIWVHGIVAFTNDHVKLEVKNPTTSVLKLPELKDFILSQKPANTFTGKELKAMGEVILDNCS